MEHLLELIVQIDRMLTNIGKCTRRDHEKHDEEDQTLASGSHIVLLFTFNGRVTRSPDDLEEST
jgi:hypothetical protein